MGKFKYTLEDMKNLAKMKEGKCISNKYKNINSKLKWRCKQNHIWSAKPSHIKEGHWCLKCFRNNKKYTLDDIYNFVKEKDGECLSKEYINAHIKLKLKCKEGHVWSARLYHIIEGHWCPECAGQKRKSIQEMQEIAKKKNGKCLSKKYYNNKQKLKWQCKEGHKWMARPHSIYINETWCPICSEGISERICRKFFESIFNVPFKKIRPNWLIGTKKRKLELDGYNKDLKIAFEYQGKQHYEYIEGFHKSIKDFKYQKEKDRLKIQKCKENGINLIQVPYRIKFKNMEKYIIKKSNLYIPFKSLNYNKIIN